MIEREREKSRRRQRGREGHKEKESSEINGKIIREPRRGLFRIVNKSTS